MEKKQFKRIGFIGLGRMGRPMAENLLRKGFSLTIFARKKRGSGRDEGPWG